jgi:GT2 family glycosyltransferase
VTVSPDISIIVPTLNRPAGLKACLEALTRLEYPQQAFEVIVVNDGGDEDLDAIVCQLEGGLRLRIVNQPHAGPAAARNNGVGHARGRFLAFTDDDCRPERDWLQALVQRLEDDPSRMYGGRTVNALRNNVYSSGSQALIDYLYAYYNADPHAARFFTSSNIALARDAFDLVGGFDTGFSCASGEDRDLCDRWLARGFGLSYVPGAIVLHGHELDLPSYWRQHFGYGAGAWRFRQRKRRRDGCEPGFEPLSFYLNVAGHARRYGLERPTAISALLLLSQVANAFGYAWAWAFEAPAGPPRAGRESM